MNMWADIVLNYPEVLDELPRDVVLLNWDYTTGGRRISRTCELRELGLPFVCCPGTSSWVSHGTRLGMSLKNVSMFAREAAKHGAEGLLNTDWGNVGHRHFLADSLCSFTHGAAHGWCTEKVDDQTHVRRFCELAFGDPEGELADAVTTLGEYPLGLNQPYLALYERLTEPRPVKVGRLLDGFCVENLMCINALEASDEEVSRRREKVAGIRWPKPSRNLTGLEKLVPDEFKASAELEALACDRILLARRVRSGKTPTGRSLRQHADALCRAGDTFGLLWRARNRPSRLADHLAAFRSAGEEAKTLASNAKRRSPHAGS